MKRRAQEEYQAVYDNIKKKQVQYKVTTRFAVNRWTFGP